MKKRTDKDLQWTIHQNPYRPLACNCRKRYTTFASNWPRICTTFWAKKRLADGWTWGPERNWFGVGKNVSKKFIDLKHAHTPKSYDDFFELAFATVGDRLTAYVDGVCILDVKDSTFLQKGAVRLAAYGCRAFFKDVEVMVLDNQ